MVSIFNRIRNTVNEVLPGNPLSQDFDIQPTVVGTCGPGLLWRIHNGTQKSTKQPVSVFVVDKKLLEKLLLKEFRKPVLETLRSGVQHLTRLRHPSILSIVHPLEENRDCLTFAAEPVQGSLSNVLGLSSDSAEDTPPALTFKSYKVADVEVRYGLVKILEALAFLHGDGKRIHGNLAPSAILVNRKGVWKLSGFDFSVTNSVGPGCAPYIKPDAQQQVPGWARPSLDYLAPEWGLMLTCDTMSDMFSLGVLIYSLYNNGQSLYKCNGHLSAYKSYAVGLKDLRSSRFSEIPADMKEYIALLLNPEPTVRPEAVQLAKVRYFEEQSVLTLLYLDTFIQRENLEKSQFFKNLPKSIGNIPLRLVLQRVLPVLFTECSNHDMVPFVISSLMAIVTKCDKETYMKRVFPGLCPLFKIAKPIQVPLLFLENMSDLLSWTDAEQVKHHVLPMIYRSLDLEGTTQIQELCLTTLPTVSHLVEASAMKHSVLPRIKALCTGTSLLKVRVQCLVCVGKMMGNMEKWFVLEQVIPFLLTVASKDPPVLMSILGICKLAYSSKEMGIPKTILADSVLPFLIKHSVDNGLSPKQFHAFMALIRDMLDSMEKEHMEKLEQAENTKLDSSKPSPFGGAAPEAFGESPSSEDLLVDSFVTGIGMYGEVPKSGWKSSSTPRGEGPPKKVPLSLEEKQQAVRKQEQMRRLDREGPLAPTGSSPSSNSTSGAKTQTRDLSSTLSGSVPMAMMMSQPKTLPDQSIGGLHSIPTPPNNSVMSLSGGFGGLNGGTTNNMDTMRTVGMGISSLGNSRMAYGSVGSGVVGLSAVASSNKSSSSGIGAGMWSQPAMSTQFSLGSMGGSSNNTGSFTATGNTTSGLSMGSGVQPGRQSSGPSSLDNLFGGSNGSSASRSSMARPGIISNQPSMGQPMGGGLQMNQPMGQSLIGHMGVPRLNQPMRPSLTAQMGGPQPGQPMGGGGGGLNQFGTGMEQGSGSLSIRHPPPPGSANQQRGNKLGAQDLHDLLG